MNMDSYRITRIARGLLAIITMMVLGVAISVSEARADAGVVAYATTTSQELRQARVALDIAISGAARRANAALTVDLKHALEDRVRSKLRLASPRTVSRG